MTPRNVTDTDGRLWACTQERTSTGALREGQDVRLVCTTASVSEPIRLSVGWQWAKMSDNGLARMIAAASPVPKH